MIRLVSIDPPGAHEPLVNHFLIKCQRVSKMILEKHVCLPLLFISYCNTVYFQCLASVAYVMVLALINYGMKQSYYTIYIGPIWCTHENKEMELLAIISENNTLL